MYNLFYDLLPVEIQKYIYEIRLYNILSNKYYIRVAQKLTLVKIITNIYLSQDDNMNIGFGNTITYDPFNIRTANIADKCSRIINRNDDINWWVFHLIRPLERGIIKFDYICGPGSSIYDKTELACEKLINNLKCGRIKVWQD
tara:strand:- start:2290 stop:2718 length:429 start_codon:yes stop_codon:yes gene_type:complete